LADTEASFSAAFLPSTFWPLSGESGNSAMTQYRCPAPRK
jgi:hypothetical protein